MIVRRIREHLGQRDWLAVLLDLVIAILGVFIGIQVSNWNEARGQRREGHEYRLRLIDDLKDNEADLIDRGKYYSAVRDHAQAALVAIDAPPGQGDARFLIDAFEATQISPRGLKRYTYDEILARGAITWVGDAGLREQIANYYVGVETVAITFTAVPPYRELVRQGMPDAAQQAVRRACPERVFFTSTGSGRARLASNCLALSLAPDIMARSATEVRAIPGLRAALNRLISDHDGKILLIGPSIAHVRDLKRRLAAADGGS